MVPSGNALGVLSSPPQIMPYGTNIGGPYTPVKNQRDKKAQWFSRDEAIHVVCRVSEKLLQRSRWDFLRRHQNG
ncbi:MAG: hypothetical protein JRE29_02085 [Deltaproteobacteria bacterium]|nr:hypothetical protein [Deltaproteobacteria bacterium]